MSVTSESPAKKSVQIVSLDDDDDDDEEYELPQNSEDERVNDNSRVESEEDFGEQMRR